MVKVTLNIEIIRNFLGRLKNVQKRIKVEILQPEYPLSINELKETFFSLQTNTSAGHDTSSFIVIKSPFGSFCKTLFHIFRLSIEERVFPDE